MIYLSFDWNYRIPSWKSDIECIFYLKSSIPRFYLYIFREINKYTEIFS